MCLKKHLRQAAIATAIAYQSVKVNFIVIQPPTSSAQRNKIAFLQAQRANVNIKGKYT